MAINVMLITRCGPGGSTRRLHHFPATASRATGGPWYGGDTGSTCVETVWFSPGMVPPLSGRSSIANDNQIALAA